VALDKCEVRGRDAGRFLGRMVTRDDETLTVARVADTCWCDPCGRVVDDGTVSRPDARRAHRKNRPPFDAGAPVAASPSAH
jgi:glycine cleavage system aminomethyltransferase T